MQIMLPSAKSLNGAYEKLKRANENILNLEKEICAFLEKGPNPIVPDKKMEALEEATKIHVNRVIPGRFGILSGEIIHHLRSCLDHIAWELSSPQKRIRDPRGIEFPILYAKPSNAKELRAYERKVEGIENAGRRIIEMLQPYNRPAAMLSGPGNDPLWIINKMDIIDKHRELIVVVGSFDIPLDGTAGAWTMLYRDADFPEDDIAGLARSLQPDCAISPQVAFREFGERKMQLVIPGLSKLSRYIGRVLAVFDRECFG